VPATGARRGDLLDCYVSAINGKSLAGGRLAFASLQGPNTVDRRVFALCQGQVMIDDDKQPAVGIVHSGCKMEADVITPFYTDDHITLILDKDHANFQTADIIAEEIERKYRSSLNYAGAEQTDASAKNVEAINAASIRVRIPEAYRDNRVGFASELLDLQVYEHEPEARVTINSRAGSIVISGDVEIGDVLISHKNVVVEAAAANAFAALDADQSSQAKLQVLVNQLNALKVPTEDMIEIIRGIQSNGKLHGHLMIDD
jgi:flagellar P-ring protein precursor FlgI